jgi:hypothetical protein
MNQSYVLVATLHMYLSSSHYPFLTFRNHMHEYIIYILANRISADNEIIQCTQGTIFIAIDIVLSSY